MFWAYKNETGFEDGPFNTAYVIMLGVLFSPIVFTGFEACATMAEETIDGPKIAPYSMIKGVAYTGLSCFLLIISMLLACRGDIDLVLNGPTEQASVNIFYYAFTSINDDGSSQKAPILAVLMTVLILINNFVNGFNQ